MLPMKNTLTLSRPLNKLRRFMHDFQKDEEGGIIIFTLVVLITMLVVGGMAVDFMRFESRRALLQSVTDRAVLAAAELDEERDPEVVVRDFFKAAGYEGAIVGTPEIESSAGSRSVKVNAEVDVNTFYLRLVGIDQLTAPAQSQAIEGTGNVEVSLILDISGSMGTWVSSESKTRMELLKEAAEQFIDDLLLPEYEDRISINLIAYSQHVSVGDDIFGRLNVTPDTIDENGVETGTIGDNWTVPEDGGSVDGEVSTVLSYTNPSRCVDFLEEEYETLTFNTARTYQQVEYFEHYQSGDAGIDFPVCPEKDFEAIIPLSQDGERLKDAISQYRPTTYTSIHLGMKWGTALLDPSTRDLLSGIGSIDPEFRGRRPDDYSSTTTKYIVLMTDGENVRGRRIENEHYNTYEWRKIWSEYPMDYWRNNIATTSYSANSLTDYPTTAAQHDTWLLSLCEEANNANIIVYTIAMGAPEHGAEVMRTCAGEDSRAFETTLTNEPGEPGIDEIFERIAAQITALRLNL